MDKYRVTIDVLVDVNLCAKSKKQAIEIAMKEIEDRGDRYLTDVSGDVKFRFMQDSAKVVVCERGEDGVGE